MFGAPQKGYYLDMRPDIREGIWRLADPKISITSAAGLLIAFSAAFSAGTYSWFWLVVTALSLFGFEVAKNAWGDVVDYDSGTDLAVKEEDRTDFSGGKRVLVDDLLTRAQTWSIAVIFGGLGALLGLLIVIFREPRAIWFGFAGTALAWSYHGMPLKFSYRGFGEIAVAVSYGPVIVLGAYLVQTGSIDWSVFWLSAPLGLLIAAFLWVNEFPDHDADKVSGKMNLVVRLGKHRSSVALAFIYFVTFSVIFALPWLTNASFWLWSGFLPVPLAIYATRSVLKHPLDFYRSYPVQPMALLAFVLYAVGLSAGVLLG